MERGETDPLSINVRTSKKKKKSKEETKKPTFFLYLVVFPTAKTPFLIALVLKCCNTT
jgi:type II restriction/modification system DNA methylase subunit YeeA